MVSRSNNWIKILLVISIGVLFFSCDKEHKKEYYIQNDVIEEIKINFKVDGIIDSVTVAANDTHLIYTDIYYFGTVGVDDDRFEDNVSEIEIERDTSILELDESLWEYEEVEKYYAKYTMVIK